MKQSAYKEKQERERLLNRPLHYKTFQKYCGDHKLTCRCCKGFIEINSGKSGIWRLHHKNCFVYLLENGKPQKKSTCDRPSDFHPHDLWNHDVYAVVRYIANQKQSYQHR